MHSTANRFQSVFSFFTTVAIVLGILTALSTVLHPANPVTSIELTNIKVVKGRPHYYSTKREEYAQIRFDLNADLSSLFNWNTKQLFVYVLASYPSTIPATSSAPPQTNITTTTESIIWDIIISAKVSPYAPSSLIAHYFAGSSKSGTKNRLNSKKKEKEEKTPGILKLRNQRPKYQITDISGKLAGRKDATLVVGWNVQPWIGPLQWSAATNIETNLGGIFGKAFIPSPRTGRSKKFEFPELPNKKADGSA